MSIISNITIDQKKPLLYFLITIYGININLSKTICCSLGYDYTSKMQDLKQKDIDKINTLINLKHKFSTSSDLKKKKYDDIQNMKDIKSYKGIRHIYNMPVNGQKTHNNAKTRG